MKAITEKQPWASLIVEGLKIDNVILFKDIENRTWKTNFRGRVLIHAAAKSWNGNMFIKYLYDIIPSLYKIFPETKGWLESLPTGSIIGSVEIVDCVINHTSIWADQNKTDVQKIRESFEITKAVSEGKNPKITYNWVLRNPILFEKPIPAKGKLSFWEFDETLIKENHV